MNSKNKWIEIIKNIGFTMVIMSLCFVLIDLYVPIKIILFGDGMAFSDIWNYVNYSKYFPIVLAVSLSLAFHKQITTKGNSN